MVPGSSRVAMAGASTVVGAVAETVALPAAVCGAADAGAALSAPVRATPRTSAPAAAVVMICILTPVRWVVLSCRG